MLTIKSSVFPGQERIPHPSQTHFNTVPLSQPLFTASPNQPQPYSFLPAEANLPHELFSQLSLEQKNELLSLATPILSSQAETSLTLNNPFLFNAFMAELFGLALTFQQHDYSFDHFKRLFVKNTASLIALTEILHIHQYLARNYALPNALLVKAFTEHDAQCLAQIKKLIPCLAISQKLIAIGFNHQECQTFIAQHSQQHDLVTLMHRIDQSIHLPAPNATFLQPDSQPAPVLLTPHQQHPVSAQPLIIRPASTENSLHESIAQQLLQKLSGKRSEQPEPITPKRSPAKEHALITTGTPSLQFTPKTGSPGFQHIFTSPPLIGYLTPSTSITRGAAALSSSPPLIFTPLSSTPRGLTFDQLTP